MKTSVIITLIGCATAVAIVAVIFDYLSDKNSDKQVELSKKIIRLHRNYIAAILGFAIIMLLTAEYGVPCYRYVYEYLSFASTITSLVLSILAIFVTVQSSSDLYKQFTKIEEATKIVKKSSEDIKETLGHLQNSEKEIKATSSEISNNFKQLADSIVEKVEEIVERSEDRMREDFKNNMKNYTLNDDSEQRTTVVSMKKESKNDFEELKKAFLDRSSNFGLIALYACVLSYEESLPFSIYSFDGDVKYFLGVLMAISSVGLVDLDRSDIEAISCTKAEYSRVDVESIIQYRIDELSKKSGRGVSAFKENFEKIKNHFGKE